MPQSGVLSLHPCPISLTNNVVFRVNKFGVNTVTITNPEIARPVFNHCPQNGKSLTTPNTVRLSSKLGKLTIVPYVRSGKMQLKEFSLLVPIIESGTLDLLRESKTEGTFRINNCSNQVEP